MLGDHGTSRLIEWLCRNEQAEVRRAAARARGVEPGVAVRIALLRYIGPLGAPPGPALELEVMLLETALEVIDWDRVVAALGREAEPRNGQDR